MTRAYSPPRIESSYPVEFLLRDAAECVTYGTISDAALKDDLRPVDEPVERLTRIGTR